MHIALINRWYPPHTGYGGVAVYNYYLAHALVELGQRVSVVTARWSRDVPALHDDSGVIVHRLLTEHQYRLHQLPIVGRYIRPIQQFYYSLRVACKLQNLEAIDCPDVIEFAEVGAEGFVYLLRRRQCPVVVRCHTPTFVLKDYYHSNEIPYDIALTSVMERYCIRNADLLTAPSLDMAQTVAKACGIPAECIRVVPNALDVSQFAPDGNKGHTPDDRRVGASCPSSITILHVGRLERIKGIEVLAKAIPEVVAQVPYVRFVFIGQDMKDVKGYSWKARLQHHFRETGVEENVLLLGGVDQSTLLAWYRSADIAVVPSLNYESFSYTCAEAMAAGLSIVASRIGGIPETIDDGVNGRLVNPGDHKGIARALLNLIQNEEERQRMGFAGKLKAKAKFDATVVASQMLRHYQKAALSVMA